MDSITAIFFYICALELNLNMGVLDDREDRWQLHKISIKMRLLNALTFPTENMYKMVSKACCSLFFGRLVHG